MEQILCTGGGPLNGYLLTTVTGFHPPINLEESHTHAEGVYTYNAATTQYEWSE